VPNGLFGCQTTCTSTRGRFWGGNGNATVTLIANPAAGSHLFT
jgi:hypothetical protein